MRYLISLVAMLMLCGCAGYKINEDGSVDSYGFLRTLTVHKKFKGDNLVEITISTDSRFKDIAIGLNEIVDSAANTGAKLIP